MIDMWRQLGRAVAVATSRAVEAKAANCHGQGSKQVK